MRLKRLPRTAAALAAVGLALSLMSCSTSVPLEGTDNDVFFPSVRILVNTFGKPDSLLDPLRAKPSLGRDPVVLLSPELDYGFGSGKISQNLTLGQLLHLDSVDINGPARVSARFDLHTGSVAARAGVWLIDAIGIEGLVGMGFTYLDVEVESGALEDEADPYIVGPLFGLQLTGRPARWVGFYGRASITAGFGKDGDDGNLGRAELGVELMPLGGLSLRGGWNWWDLDISRHNDADIDLKLQGPFAGIELRF